MWSVLCFLFWCTTLVQTQSPRRTNLNRCKLTHTGLEYNGTISRTESGLFCAFWETDDPVTKYHRFLTDEDFPEKSKSAARNYCRNVRGRFETPWCFTTDSDVAEEICEIPLCNFNCQITMVGAEYGGYTNESITGRKCVTWSEKTYRKYLKKQKITTSERVLLDGKFPELSRKKAVNFCRNPTGDVNGPWCIVESEFSSKDKYEKEYCDVPRCSESNCTAGTGRIYDKNVSSHFVNLSNETTFQFSILLWNINLEEASFHVRLSAYPLPLFGEKLIDMYNGIEILINKDRVAFVHGEKQKPNWEDIPNLLSGVNKRTFTVSWYPATAFMSMKMSGISVMLETDYNDPSNRNKTIMGQKNNELSYYSILGDAALWQLPCSSVCLEHITIQPYCNVHKKLNKTIMGHELAFIVRSDHTVFIELRISPNTKYPFFRIEILGALNKSSITVIQDGDSTPEYLQSSTHHNILSYWSWSKFQLSASEDRLRLDWIQSLIPSQTIFDIQHGLLGNAKWYSICSKGTAHWMFFCEPEDIPVLPSSKPPECAISKKAETYEGTQWVSSTGQGQPCFPWIYEGVVEQTNDLSFVKTSRENMKNYCRNLDDDVNGPYCYTADVDSLPDLVMKKESCNIRPCPESQCRTTGIGREYAGNRNVTKSGRICEFWEIANVTFPPNNYAANLTENYCRNPNDQLLGPWCYTTDPLVPMDLCDIHDCFVNEACTLITADDQPTRQFYLRPEWISDKFSFKVKTWDPWYEAGIEIILAFENSYDYYGLKVGIENNTKIKLVYHLDNGTDISLKEQLATKLIPSGYWQGFWIRVPPNNIELGYEGSETSIFVYEHPYDSELPYTFARFIAFLNLDFYFVGFNFPCSYCLIEKFSTFFGNIYYPFNMWSENNPPGVLTLHMRSTTEDDISFIMIKLYHMIDIESMIIFINGTHISLISQNFTSPFIHDSKEVQQRIIAKDYWSTLTIRIINYTNIQVSDQYQTLLNWSSTDRALNFYYFVITNDGSEYITWVANCNRPVIDESAIDGNWSEWGEWVCNVRCGGGLGFRTRQCNNPKPNFNGKPCLGPNTEDGACNEFECGCINPVTMEKAKQLLELRAVNKETKEGESITLECNTDIVEEIKSDSPGSYIQWLKDGYSIKKNRKKLDRLDLSKIHLTLSDPKEDDSGVYICIINPDCLPINNSTVIPISIVALIVNSNQIHYVRETTTYQANCKGLPLSFIYTDLSQSWELDNELLIDYTTTALAEANLDNLYDVDRYYTGIWQCKIFQTKLKFTWITNRFRIEVIDPPTFYSYMSEEDAPSVIFRGWNHNTIIIFLWMVIFLEIATVSYIIYWYHTTRQQLLGNA